MLHLLLWDETDVMAFPWFEQPGAERVEQAMALLRQLGAIDAGSPGRLTNMGRRMGRLPVEPRIARLMCDTASIDHSKRLALVAALLSERDPFSRRSEGGPPLAARHWSNSDVLDHVAAFEEFEQNGERESEVGRLDAGAARFILRARDQLLRELAADSQSLRQSSEAESTIDVDAAVRRALLAAYPDRVARRRDATG